jgi:hypothetical protein
LASNFFSPCGELLSSRQQAGGYSAGIFIKRIIKRLEFTPMKIKMKFLISLLILGALLLGAGLWFLLNPVQGIQVADSAPITVKLPETPPMIFEKLEYIMRGEFDSLYIYSDGSIIYIEEKGLRMPMPDHPPTRTWKLGKLNEEELVSLINLFQSSQFTALVDYYQYPGKPTGPTPSSEFIMGDGSFTFSINYAGFQKEVVANDFLPPDHGETYPDMPFPLNDIYVKLRDVILNHTKEISTETLSIGGD